MNALLINRDGFQVPSDGFYQIAPLGEFGHAQAGLVQIVDAQACAAMVNRFTEDAKAPNFAGLLVDFDHFSLDVERSRKRPDGSRHWKTGMAGCSRRSVGRMSATRP